MVEFRRLNHCWMRKVQDFPAHSELAQYDAPEGVWDTSCEN